MMKQFISFLLLIIAIVAIGLYLNTRREKKIIEDSCYADAININVVTNSKGRRMILYKIVVDNKEYNCISQFPDDKEIPLPKEVKVRYVCSDPDINEIIFE